MYNRSNSFLKRFKTEKTERKHILEWKPSAKTPTSRHDITNRSPIKCQTYQIIQLKQKNSYIIKCINHPSKKATFELKQSLKQAYCQDCSIKLVKHNIRMCKITEESLCLRAMYEAEIQKITNYQEEIREALDKYFENQRQSVKQAFQRCKQSHQKVLKIPIYKLPKFNQNDLLMKLPELLGSVQFKNIQLVKNKFESEEKNYFHQVYLKNISDLNNVLQYNQPYQNKQNVNNWNRQVNLSSYIRQKQVAYQNGGNLICEK